MDRAYVTSVVQELRKGTTYFEKLFYMYFQFQYRGVGTCSMFIILVCVCCQSSLKFLSISDKYLHVAEIILVQISFLWKIMVKHFQQIVLRIYLIFGTISLQIHEKMILNNRKRSNIPLYRYNSQVSKMFSKDDRIPPFEVRLVPVYIVIGLIRIKQCEKLVCKHFTM